MNPNKRTVRWCEVIDPLIFVVVVVAEVGLLLISLLSDDYLTKNLAVPFNFILAGLAFAYFTKREKVSQFFQEIRKGLGNLAVLLVTILKNLSKPKVKKEGEENVDSKDLAGHN